MHRKAGLDVYLQWHLYMKVYPMMPFPDADHSIAPDARCEAGYLTYGPMFRALRNMRWNLVAHAVVNVSSSDGAGRPMANAFAARSGDASFVYAVVGAGNSTAYAQLAVRAMDANVSAPVFAYLQPGASSTWQPLRGAARQGDYFQLQVPLQQGAALVRMQGADV